MSAATCRAWAQLLRLPNAFTAVADPLAGWFLAGQQGALGLLLGASACLYTGGIVLNDCFDFTTDQQERPDRPLPSGQVSRPAAWVVGFVLLLTGLICAVAAGRSGTGLALVAGILFYDGWAKRYVLPGVLALTGCRFANFMLGLNQLHPAPFILAGYVAILSLIARREAVQPALQMTVRRLLLNLIVLDALFVAVTGNFLGASLVLALLVPAWALSRILKMT